MGIIQYGDEQSLDMSKMSEKQNLEKVEALLRQHGGTGLSPDFKRRVMAAVGRLPEPALLARQRGWRAALRLLGPVECAALLLILVALLLLFIPGASAWLSAMEWELSDMALSLTLGKSVLSVSMLSVLMVAAGLALLGGIGELSNRQRLLGA